MKKKYSVRKLKDGYGVFKAGKKVLETKTKSTAQGFIKFKALEKKQRFKRGKL